MKPPRFPTVFESMLNAIACQQMSLTVGILLLNRLVENFGLVAACDGMAHMLSRGRKTSRVSSQRPYERWDSVDRKHGTFSTSPVPLSPAS